ncbi:hypothetical protein [Methylobacterium sp. Leaf125]|uniref:hypothetical protein n=1 Tax=Methylobacterium sp. Leaf125 TaxID=1736265 RepID=UPI000B1BCB9F|nr:hypothetical protein [Methylobacterium sp. Leaf125]
MASHININDPQTITYLSVRALIASEEDSADKNIFILSDGSVAILHQIGARSSNVTRVKLELSNGGNRRWGAKAVRDSDWIIKIHDELLRQVPNQHKGFIED